jgi:outer membrane biosynthesis protein TonB
MTRSSSVLRVVSAAAVIAGLALVVCLSAAAPGHAETSGPTPALCLLNCATGDPKPPPDGAGKGKPTDTPTVAPTTPPPPPAPPVPAAPAPVPTLAPEPTVSPAEETPSDPPSTTIPSPSPSSATPSTESNWNKPVTKSAKPTQAAAVSRDDGSGLFGSPGLLAIMAGVLLVGLAGLAFAWWSRNRLSSH